MGWHPPDGPDHAAVGLGAPQADRLRRRSGHHERSSRLGGDAVWECMRPWIEAEARSAHVLRFSGMDNGPMAARVRVLGTRPGWRTREPVREVVPFLELPPTYDEYERGLSSNRRQQVRRFSRRLQQQ